MRVCWKMAHRTLSGAPGPSASELATLGNSLGLLRYNSLDCPVVSGATAPYAPRVDCRYEQ
jgi:hypothetical protein